MKRIVRRKTLISVIMATLFLVNTSWAIVVIPPPDMVPLSQVGVPQPPNLLQFVKDRAAAVKLGKAFFWDMQAGSDGIQACATCHFSAGGVDSRLKNSLHPGPDNIFGNVTSVLAGDPAVSGFPQFGPNYQLQPTDFPLHQRQAPDFQSPVIRDTNDVVGSQGVRRTDFVGIVAGSAVEIGNPVPDPVFNVAGVNVRQVTRRQAPSNINAIFNFTNLWDGRASYIFNGENPFGLADPNAGAWFNVNGNLVKQPVAIEFAALASQAVDPPMSSVEMSFRGRTFPELGRKLLSLTPLAKQLVHPNDSVLGTVSRSTVQPGGTVTGEKGLNTTYSQMIKDAFVNRLWDNTIQTVTVNTVGGPAQFSQMEANFSLFWGLAIQIYESTLISDQTLFDQFLGGDATALTDEQKVGLQLFIGVANCSVCHAGTELTANSATVTGFINNVDHGLLDLMFTADGNQSIYDQGFFGNGVTPTADDIGRGGTMPFTNSLTGLPYPLSFTALAELQALGKLPFETPALGLVGPFVIPPDFPQNVNGLFKAPTLRNIELTAPYFHNGHAMTLEDAVDFYTRGGNFPQTNVTDLDPLILTGVSQLVAPASNHAAMVAFLKSLTDPRVVNQSAPFDHPEIFVPEGDPEVLWGIPATDALGQAAAGALTFNGITSPTSSATQMISGTVEAGVTPTVTVNTTATVGPVTASGTNWSTTITGLALGSNVISVRAVLTGGVDTTLTETIVLDPSPVAVADSATTPMNTAVEVKVLENDSDLGGGLNPTSVAIQSQPPNGSVSVNPSNGFVTYTPSLNYIGTDSFTYTVQDNLGGVSNAATVTINVTGTLDTITITRATFTAKKVKRVPTGTGTWSIIGGKTTAPGTTLTVYVGADASGAAVGTCVATGNGTKGKFKLMVRNSAALPDGTKTISMKSSNGTLAGPFPVTVR